MEFSIKVNKDCCHELQDYENFNFYILFQKRHLPFQQLHNCQRAAIPYRVNQSTENLIIAKVGF